MLVLQVCECVAVHAGHLGPVSPELDEQQGQLLRLQDSGETGEKALQEVTTRAAVRCCEIWPIGEANCNCQALTTYLRSLSKNWKAKRSLWVEMQSTKQIFCFLAFPRLFV